MRTLQQEKLRNSFKNCIFGSGKEENNVYVGDEGAEEQTQTNQVEKPKP